MSHLDPDVMDLIEAFGPPLLKVAAAALALLGTATGFAARFLWQAHLAQLDAVKAQVEGVRDLIKQNRVTAHDERERVQVAMQDMQEELDRARQTGADVERRVTELSGHVCKQQTLITDTMRRVAEVAGKLEGVLRFSNQP